MYCFINLIINLKCFKKAKIKEDIEYIKKIRGKNYDPAYKNCLLTHWEVCHIIEHMLIGYFFNLKYSLMIGIPWELYEYTQNIHNLMDPVYNTLGAVIGVAIRTCL